MKEIGRLLEIWLSSILIASLCWPIALIASWLLLLRPAGPEINLQDLFVLGAVGGLLIGVVQRAALGNRVAATRFWIPATVAGGAGGVLFAALVISRQPSGWWWLLAGTAGGALMGWVQSLAAREKRGVKLGLIVATAVSWAVAYGLSPLLAHGSASGIAMAARNVTAQVLAIGWAATGLIALFVLVAATPMIRRDASRARLQWW